MANYFQMGPVAFDKKIFKVFPLDAIASSILQGIEIFEHL